MEDYKHVPPKCQNTLANIAQALVKAKDASPETAGDIVSNLYKQGLEKKKPTVFSMLNEFLINSMLSGLGTPLVNVVSNLGNTLVLPSLNYLKSIPKGSVARREAAAMFSALSEGWKTDLMFFKGGWKTGMPVDFELTPKALGLSKKQFNELMIEAGATPDIDGNVNPELAAKVLGESYDYITKAIPGRVGEIVRIPTRATVAIDEYFKARMRTQKIFGDLSRKASADEAAGKGDYKDLFEKYKKEVFSEGAEEYRTGLSKVFEGDVDLVNAIADVRNYAIDGTFQTKLDNPILRGLEVMKGDGRSPMSLAITQAFPFLRTPWNLFKEGMSYVPGVGFVVRPTRTTTVTEVTPTGRIKEKQQLVKMPLEDLVPRQVVAFGLLAGVGAMYFDGKITGAEPTDPAERRRWQIAGKQPYSIKVGDTWYSYGRFDPFATPVGVVVDVFRSIDEYNKTGISQIPDEKKRGEETREYYAEQLWGSVKSHVMQKVFLEGVADMITASESPEGMKAYLDNIAKRFVPAGVANVARAIDPYERVATTTTEKMQQRVPGLREELPKRYEIFQPEGVITNASQAVTSVPISKDAKQIQKDFFDLGVKFKPVSRTMGGVDLTNEQFSDYQRFVAEEGTKYFEKRMDTFKKMGPEKRKMIEYVIENKHMPAVTKRARLLLQKKYPELRVQIRNEMLLERGRPDRYIVTKEEE
jgi:hypothetical protein